MEIDILVEWTKDGPFLSFLFLERVVVNHFILYFFYF
jgi:hypothetical protein